MGIRKMTDKAKISKSHFMILERNSENFNGVQVKQIKNLIQSGETIVVDYTALLKRIENLEATGTWKSHRYFPDLPHQNDKKILDRKSHLTTWIIGV